MTYSKRLNNRGRTRYAGHHMPISTILPGAVSLARIPMLSKEAKKRLAWMDFYRTHGKNAALTCRHFGISRQCFHKWRKRYEPFRLASLEEESRRPKRTRQCSFPCRTTSLAPRLQPTTLLTSGSTGRSRTSASPWGTLPLTARPSTAR